MLFNLISYHLFLNYIGLFMGPIFIFLFTNAYWFYTATSMLATDVGDEICWRQLWDVGDGFGQFCHQHPLSKKTIFQHQGRAPRSKRCHQYRNSVTNIQKSSRFRLVNFKVDFYIFLRSDRLDYQHTVWTILYG